MARRTLALIPVLTLLALTGAGLAAESPVGVSPGNASNLALVEARCPTFSWGAVEGATSYELVVYRLGVEGEEAKARLRQRFHGSVTSWTPSLDSCLARGGQYAWSMRAVAKKAASEWSTPNLFEVTLGPSELEFKAALEIVRSYVGDQSVWSSALENGSSAGGLEGKESSGPSLGVSDSPAPRALALAGDPAVQVNGAAVVTTATLIGGLCEALSYRYVDRGDGTILDCNTGLLWLKDASCTELVGTDLSGRASFQEAIAAVIALEDGSCGLTDGSAPFNWTLPTIEQFCSAFAGVEEVCPAAAGADSLLDTSLLPDSALNNARGDGPWKEEDAFVGVKGGTGGGYWSSTPSGETEAWVAAPLGGELEDFPRSADFYVWPVRTP